MVPNTVRKSNRTKSVSTKEDMNVRRSVHTRKHNGNQENEPVRLSWETRKGADFKDFKPEVNKIIDANFSKEAPSGTHKTPFEVGEDIISKKDNISHEYEGDGKFIPKFKIVNSPSFASVVVSLKKGQSVYCNHGLMNYCDGTVDISTKSQGIFRSLIRTIFTTSSFFLNYYTGVYDKESVVSFSSFLPGDIIAMRIKKGEKFIMSQNGFLCATPNIKISTATRFRNLIVRNERVAINEVSIMDNCEDDGMVWIASYGGFDKLTVKDGESIKVNGGIFAFTNSDNRFTLTTEGNVKSFLFSGQTILMRFRGPCELYVHSQNFGTYTKHLKSLITKTFMRNFRFRRPKIGMGSSFGSGIDF